MKKRIWIILLLCCFLLPLPLQAFVKKSYQRYVTDEAEILTMESKNYIVKYSDFLYRNKKIDYYVVTVKNLGTMSLEEYADQVFQEFGISDKGILILVSKEDRKIRVQLGDNLTKDTTNKMIEEYIQKYFIPYLEREEWNDGIINGYTAFYKYICEEYGIDASSMEVVDKLDFLTKYRTMLGLVIIWFSVMFANMFAKFFQKARIEDDNVSVRQIIGIGILMVLNIALISLSYLLQPVYVILCLAFEGITFYSTYQQQPKRKAVKRRVKVKKQTTKPKRTTKRVKRRKY